MKENNITVAYVSSDNPRDRRSWSGTHYRMLSALQNEFSNVEVIGPFRLHFLLSFFLKLRNLKHKVYYGKKYDRAHCHLRSKYYARIVSKRIKNKNIDVIFAPVGCTEIAHLNTTIPICHLGDSSFNQIKDYYKSFSGISKKSIDEANTIEQRSISNSAVQVFSSEWAATYATSYYNAKNAVVVGFGANIDIPPKKDKIIKDYSGTINILFLGVDWTRKGGDIVLDTIEILSKKHENFHVTVCGCIPPKKHPKMTVIPFLNKNQENDRITFDDLLCKSHILFVPTRADCTPIVFCEASAYGITTITTDTGGVTSIIKDGINGYALPIQAKPEDYADKISSLIENPKTLERLSLSSRERYDSDLNWDVWGKRMREILTTISKQKNN